MKLEIFYWAMSLVIINTLVLCLATSPSIFAEPHPKSFLANLFFYTGYVSQLFIYALLIGVVLFITGYAFQSPYVFIPISSVVSMIVLFFLIANSVTYAKYRFNINRTIFNLVFSRGAREVVQPSSKEIIIFFCGLSFAFLVSASIQIAVWSISLSFFQQKLIELLLIIMILMYVFNQILYLICSHYGYMPVLQYTVKIYGYDLFSIYRLLHRSGAPLTNQRNQLIHDLKLSFKQKKTIQYPLASIVCKNSKQIRKNILMIVIDSWRFDMLCPKVMPNIYEFSQQAERFNNHWSSGNTTQPGLFGLFYGLPANYWDAIKQQKIPPVFIEQLQQAGYEFKILASANLVNPPFHQTIFSSINDLRKFTPGSNPLERDQNISETMIDFLHNKKSNEPFFGFLFYDAAHGYYAIPNLPKRFSPIKKTNHISISKNIDPTPIFNLYKNALHSIDQYIQQVLFALEKTNLLDNTIVIITSDHGQEFDDHKKNYWEHPSNFGRYQVKVPLIVKYPNKSSGEHHHFTTHYDVTPMLLQDVLGVTNPSEHYSIGTHLYEKKVRDPFVVVSNYTNFGIVDEKHIINLQNDGHFHITDLHLNQLELMQPDIDTMNHAIYLFNRYYQ